MRRCFSLIFFILLLTACRKAPGSPPAPVLPTTVLPAPSLTSTLAGVPTLASSPTPTTFPVGPWKLVAVHNLTHNVMAAGFLTEEYGITVGTYPGLPFYTTDAGKTWTAGEMQADCRYGLDIIDEQIAWASGGAMNVRHSTDGGARWPPVTDYGKGTTRPFHTISFLNDRIGWQATLYMFGSTIDGGTTWKDVPLPPAANDIATVYLTAPAQGYAIDFSGMIFFTQDNGSHWRELSRLDLGGLVLTKAAYQMIAIRFYDPNNGLIVVSQDYQRGKVKAFHTTDGGLSWTSELIPVAAGPVFLSRREPLLTVLNGADILTVLRYVPDK